MSAWTSRARRTTRSRSSYDHVRERLRRDGKQGSVVRTAARRVGGSGALGPLLDLGRRRARRGVPCLVHRVGRPADRVADALLDAVGPPPRREAALGLGLLALAVEALRPW